MENTQKPPEGLKPRYIHDGERIDDILCAIERYTDANMSVPKSWIAELRDLIDANLKRFEGDIEVIRMNHKCKDCRNCTNWENCPCGKPGHDKGTAIGYSTGECKDYEPKKS